MASSRATCALAGALLGVALLWSVGGGAPTFLVARLAPGGADAEAGAAALRGAQRPLVAADASSAAGVGLAGGLATAALGAVALGALAARLSTRRRTAAAAHGPAGRVLVPMGSSVAPASCETFVRDRLVACRAELRESGLPSVEETDSHMEELEAVAKKVAAGAVAAVVFTGSMADVATAYPIYAQQNYANPREPTGKLACANCHLAGKPIDVRMPHDVLPDTIFKATVEIPLKYEKRRQLIADGSKSALNVGAIAVMPEGFQLAPKARLPKPLKKQMKGLAWAPYSKEKPNIVVAGPVPGNRYSTMTLPILAPDPNTNKEVHFDNLTFFWGGNRGRGQVYPEGNLSNNNQFFAPLTGKVTAIDASKVTFADADGNEKTVDCLPGANVVVEVGEAVKKDDPITTNPNVGGFGQGEADVVLQDMNRIYAYCALATSIFLAQLAFVLKKKQFEKVQLAEGF